MTYAAVIKLIVLIALGLMVGCARKPILAITVGGIGLSQMGTVRRAIQKECPKAEVRSAGAWDAYKKDVSKMVRDSRHDHVVLVGHSLGCQTAAKAAAEASKVDLLVLIEPAWDDIRLPRSVQRCLWYQRSSFDWVRAAKVAGQSARKVDGGHNDVAHSQEVVAEVVSAINEIKISSRRRK